VQIGLEAMRAAQAAGGVEGVSDADMAAMRAAMEEHDEVSHLLVTALTYFEVVMYSAAF
jgi:hypothetical protein